MSPRFPKLSDELKHDKRYVRREFSGSIMSSMKWQTVFETFEAPQLSLKQAIVKFIDVDLEKRLDIPCIAIYSGYVNSMTFGVFPMASIEWLEVPAEATIEMSKGIPARRLAQDVRAVRAALEATGKQFPLTETESGLRITGHVR